MKKLVLPLITLIIGLVAGFYYANSKSTATAAVAALTDTAGFKSENSISYDEAKMLVDTFGTRGLDDDSNKPGGRGSKTRSIFMPLSKLDSLVAALDAARKKDGKTDGLRIYFGRYPKLQLDRMPYQHPYRNTIILVSTKDTSVLPKGAKDPIHIHIDYFGAPNHKLPMHLFAVDPQNRGEMCPNNCDGALLL
ncbi:hypothetical protein [Mucilaginibacter sp.]|uniref:hypothetical protein n=1 Tax=Mucilaginibacter sp. TaxID=1882438 RepID=UPI002636420B|nr:hypothetical protein [Mucilaginibacter sp.]MDB5031566.1 hypothetical protein [Mucilaginibacter sp.]